MIRTTQNGEHWIPLGDETLKNYSAILHQWTHTILLTIDGHESGYKFPLTEDDLERASKLKDVLQQSPKQLHIQDHLQSGMTSLNVSLPYLPFVKMGTFSQLGSLRQLLQR